MHLRVHHQFRKVDNPRRHIQMVPLRGLFHALNIADSEFRLLRFLKQHENPLAVDALHIAVLRQTFNGPAYRIAGTAKTLREALFRWQFLRILPRLNRLTEFQINRLIFCCRHSPVPFLCSAMLLWQSRQILKRLLQFLPQSVTLNEWRKEMDFRFRHNDGLPKR